jgi:hypothetical protein
MKQGKLPPTAGIPPENVQHHSGLSTLPEEAILIIYYNRVIIYKDSPGAGPGGRVQAEGDQLDD